VSNRPTSSGAMGCLSALLGFLALAAVLSAPWLASVVLSPMSDPSYHERWLLLTVRFTVCASVVALVLAFIALLRRYPGRGYAVGGILLAGGAMLVTGFSLHSDVERKREFRAYMSCKSNLMQLGLAQSMYSTDWNDRLPPASDWVGALAPYVRHRTYLFVCAADRRRQRQTSGELETSYTMNELCDGQDSAAFNVPAETPVLFDGTALYGRDDVAAFRHPSARKDRLNVVYVDGHFEVLDKPSFDRVRWQP